jgi:hypothetical protein
MALVVSAVALGWSGDAQAQSKKKAAAKPRPAAAAPAKPPSPFERWGITADDLRQAPAADLLAKAGFPAKLALAQGEADNGEPVAMTLVALAYVEGYGAPKDYAAAKRYAELAAAQLQPRALNTMGLLYLNGWGVKRDRKAADVWFKQEEELLIAAGVKREQLAQKPGTAGAGRSKVLGALASAITGNVQPAAGSGSAKTSTDDTAVARPAPPPYPTTKCNQTACWGMLAQIEGTRFSYSDWTVGTQGWIRYEWVKPGQVMRVWSSFGGNAPATWELKLDPKTRMPGGAEVLADGSLAGPPVWYENSYIRSLKRVVGGRYEEVTQEFRKGQWADKKHFLGLGTYKQAYQSDQALRERQEARSQFWGNVAQGAVAISQGIAEQQAYDNSLNAIRSQGAAQTAQIIANAQQQQQQRQAREAESQRQAAAQREAQQAAGRAALTQRLAEANAYRERQIAQSSDPAERARLAEVSRKAIADTQRQLGPTAAAQVQAQTRAIVAGRPSGAVMAQAPAPPAQDSAPMKLGPRPPKGAGNCDPGPCRNPVAPPPPIRLEKRAGGSGSSGPTDAVSDPYPLMLSSDKCDKAIQPTLERTQRVIEMKGGGDWFRWDGRITQTGYTAVACLIHPNGREYFVVQGYATAGDATRAALELARRAKGERDSRYWVTSAGAPYQVK